MDEMDTSEQHSAPPAVKQETEDAPMEASEVEEKAECSVTVVNEESAPSPTTGDDPPTNPWSNCKCVFCEQVLTASDSPKLLECLHASCSSCISAKLNESNQVNGDIIIESNVVICPVCLVNCYPINIIENQFLLEAEGESDNAQTDPKANNLKCTSCHDNAAATSWCVECSEYICDGCVQAHQRLKITKEHTIKPKEEAEQDSQASASTSVPRSLYCSVHRHERLSLFCETCDKLTCRDCQLTDHRDHKYKFIHEIAAETRNMINGLLSEVSYKRVLLTSAMKVIDDRQNLIVQKKKVLVKEITHLVVKLTNAINARGKQLVMQLNEVCDNKQKTLKEKKMALEQLSNLTDHCIDFVNNALNKGSDMALLFSKRTLQTHLQRIKSRRADIPNPEIPVRIHLAMEKVPDLIKVVSGIGGIVVDGRVYASTSGLNQPSSSQSSPAPQPQSQPLPQHQPQQQPPPQPQPQSHQHQHHQQQQQHTHHQQHPQQQQQQQAPPALHQIHSAPQQQAPHQQVPHQLSPHQQLQHSLNLAARAVQHQQQQQQQQQQQHAQQPPPYPGTRMSPGHMQQSSRTSPHQAAAAAAVAAARSMRHMPPSGQLPLVQGVGLPTAAPPQQQVTSSTHPQTMGVDGMNLRGLLSPQHTQQSAFVPHPIIRVSMAGHGLVAGQAPAPGYRLAGGGAGPGYPQSVAQRPYPTPLQHLQMCQPPPQVPQGPPQQARGPPQAVVFNNPGMRAMHSRVPSPQGSSQMALGPGAGVQWHIPQHAGGLVNGVLASPGAHSNGVLQALRPPPPALPIDESFKITLKTQAQMPMQTQRGTPAAPVLAGGGGLPGDGNKMVSSSVSKTPSPSQGRIEDPERNLDTFCQESVNDLMATIAKLDRNGIEVVPEDQKASAPGDVPLADSSTGLDEIAGTSQVTTPTAQDNEKSDSSGSEAQKDDPNEDWCAVCMDGGELVCCDKCPKVFHVNCHIPNLKGIPEESETWQCLLCTNIKEVLDGPPSPAGEKHAHGLCSKDQKVAQRILLEIYCQYEPSLHFREAIGPEVAEYHDVIRRPMSLDVVRRRLDTGEPNMFNNLQEFVGDVRLIFRNAYQFNTKDSRVHQDAKTLEEFFDKLLEKWLPALAYDSWTGRDDDDDDDDDDIANMPQRKYRRILTE